MTFERFGFVVAEPESPALDKSYPNKCGFIFWGAGWTKEEAWHRACSMRRSVLLFMKNPGKGLKTLKCSSGTVKIFEPAGGACMGFFRNRLSAIYLPGVGKLYCTPEEEVIYAQWQQTQQEAHRLADAMGSPKGSKGSKPGAKRI